MHYSGIAVLKSVRGSSPDVFFIEYRVTYIICRYTELVTLYWYFEIKGIPILIWNVGKWANKYQRLKNINYDSRVYSNMQERVYRRNQKYMYLYLYNFNKNSKINKPEYYLIDMIRPNGIRFQTILQRSGYQCVAMYIFQSLIPMSSLIELHDKSYINTLK